MSVAHQQTWMMCKNLCGWIQSSLYICPRVVELGHMVVLTFAFWGNLTLVSIVTVSGTVSNQAHPRTAESDSETIEHLHSWLLKNPTTRGIGISCPRGGTLLSLSHLSLHMRKGPNESHVLPPSTLFPPSQRPPLCLLPFNKSPSTWDLSHGLILSGRPPRPIRHHLPGPCHQGIAVLIHEFWDNIVKPFPKMSPGPMLKRKEQEPGPGKM